MEASPPETALFGKYEIGNFLGGSAFAQVYRARNLKNGQTVAIKIINKNKLCHNNNNPALLISNIKNQISIMGKLHHTNIVNFFEVLDSMSEIYIVMELVEGGDLYSRIKNNKRPFSSDFSRRVFRQLISAVSYCHSRGVYHTDLKLQNILFDENGDVKVSYFGLRALIDHQIQSDGEKIDVWSCGAILFVLTAGRFDDQKDNVMEIYKKIYEGEFQCPRWMSSELKSFLSRILDFNPMTRITMDEIKLHPWFKKGLMDVVEINEEEVGLSLNAFDLISFSPGLDLSRLFDDSFSSGDDLERLVVEDSPQRIMEKVSEKVKEEGDGNVVVWKMKDWSVELEGQTRKFCISLQVYHLTNDLIIVEAKRLSGEAVHFNQLWKNKIKPEILNQKESIK